MDSVYTENDLAFPLLRLEDAYVVPTEQFFTWDDGKSSLGEDILEATLVDRFGAIWRILEVTRVALPRAGLFSRQRYVRRYRLDRAGEMTLDEVKATILPVICSETLLWKPGPRVDDMVSRIQGADDMAEVCNAAKQLG